MHREARISMQVFKKSTGVCLVVYEKFSSLAQWLAEAYRLHASDLP